MFNIDQFLKRFRKIGGDSTQMRAIISSTLKNLTKIDVPIESIEVKSSKIYIKNISQTARSEIYIKKVALLEEINRNLKQPLKEIR